MTSDAVGAQCTCATSASSPWWLRSIPMTGVMPLPAVRKRTLAGAGLGRVKSPVAWSSMTRVPALASRTRWFETLPSGIALVVMATQPAGMPAAAVPSARWVRL